MLAGLDAPPPSRRRRSADILDLTEQMADDRAMQAPAAPSFRTIEAQSDVVFDDPRRPSRRRRAGRAAARCAAAAASLHADDRSADVGRDRAAVDSAFNALAQPCWCRTPGRWRTW